MTGQGGNLNEAAAFVWMVCYGFAVGFLFDLTAFFRRLVRPGGFSSFFIDLFYCLMVGVGFLFFLYAGWQGEMRLYWILGAVAGFGVYYVGPGRGIRRMAAKWANKIRHSTGRYAREAEERIHAIAERNRAKAQERKKRRDAYRERLGQKRKTQAE